MMDFTVGGEPLSIDHDVVEKKLTGVRPEKVRALAVEVNGVVYPVKQALALASGLDRAGFTSHEAWRVFKSLGFALSRAQ
jgi:hypothetical protein